MSVNFGDALKAKQLRQFFNDKGRIYIVVDATSDDVVVPDFLQGDPALRLVLNSRMPQPIYFRDTFVESNFSFSGVAHHCVIPFHRIWAAYMPDNPLDSGLVWEECIPETVKMVLSAADEMKEDEEVDLPTSAPVPVPTPTMTVASENEGEGKSKKARKTGHLRIVK